MTRSSPHRVLLLVATSLLAACAHAPRRPGAPVLVVPPDRQAALMRVPDAVPRVEPRSAYGNPASYDAAGHHYVVLASSDGYDARGIASWYGPTFDGGRTSSGERYDMYAMTAAHKTLPLPCYARVTNLSNGRSVVVRINDRGPFIDNRIIDLSYTAALKLDMIGTGTAPVEVRTIDPTATMPLAPAPMPLAPATPPPVTPLTASVAPAPARRPTPTPASEPLPASAPEMFIQVGAFANSDNAERVARKLRNAGLAQVFTLLPKEGQSLMRVRIGPIADLNAFDSVIARLVRLGFVDAALAHD